MKLDSASTCQDRSSFVWMYVLCFVQTHILDNGILKVIFHVTHLKAYPKFGDINKSAFEFFP